MDGARGLVDLAWLQNTPIFHPDDIDCDPRFNQYPFQEGDNYDDDDEGTWKWRVRHRVELVMPQWHRWLIPGSHPGAFPKMLGCHSQVYAC